MSAEDNTTVSPYDDYAEYQRKKEEEERVTSSEREYEYYTNRGGQRVKVKYSPETKFEQYPSEVEYTGSLLSGKTLYQRLWKRERGINVNNELREDAYRRYQSDKARFVKSFTSQLKLSNQREGEVISRAMTVDFRKYSSYGGMIACVLGIAAVIENRHRIREHDDFTYPDDTVENEDKNKIVELAERHDVNLRDSIDKYHQEDSWETTKKDERAGEKELGEKGKKRSEEEPNGSGVTVPEPETFRMDEDDRVTHLVEADCHRVRHDHSRKGVEIVGA